MPTPTTRSVIIVGGGLAGLSAAAALGSAGYRVKVFESRPFPGGRATSYPIPPGESDTPSHTETIDNCQHILLRCCVNLLNFYERLGAQAEIRFHRQFYFLEPGGRVSVLKRGLLPAPAHFAESFVYMSCLTWGEKVALARALLALRRERTRRDDLDRITMAQWLVEEQRQPPRVIDRFWRQVLVSAINEDLERMAALHGFQVFWLGFLASSNSYEMGIPKVPLAQLYSAERWAAWPGVELCLRAHVEEIEHDGIRNITGVRVGGAVERADYYVSALPFDRAASLLPPLGIDYCAFEHSPITGIHLWFDRPVTSLPHATLLDRTMQWMFNKHHGRHIQLVVSASRNLVPMSRGDVIRLALEELAEFFPEVSSARLERAHVVKEVRATFSARPGLEVHRPEALTAWSNLFLAGDWTRTGWPATMEGAVRSGYLAAEAVSKADGQPRSFLLPDIA
jgi:squalene-associated FAD-dependent desaturase